MKFSTILGRLFEYYEVSSITELAELMETSQPQISMWKKRESINSISKKCKELGIYEQIFKKPDLDLLNRHNLNHKLFTLPRTSIVYLYYLLKKEQISNLEDFKNWNKKRNMESSFHSFLREFKLDYKDGNVSMSTYRLETLEYLDYFLSIDEQNYFFENQEQFIKFLFWAAEEKR